MSEITEINVETGETIMRERTKAEQKLFDDIKAQNEANDLIAQAKESAKLSAENKLAALGLTAEEIAAFRG